MKRSYDEFSKKPKKKRVLKRQDEVDDEIEKGGSSQDKFESDFIDDDVGS